MNQGDRVKRTLVKLHDEGMPHITRYGTLVSRSAYGDQIWDEITWDDGSVTKGFSPISGVFPIDARLRFPEPIAFVNPVGPNGPEYSWSGNERINEYSASREEYDRKVQEVREQERQLAAGPR